LLLAVVAAPAFGRPRFAHAADSGRGAVRRVADDRHPNANESINVESACASASRRRPRAPTAPPRCVLWRAANRSISRTASTSTTTRGRQVRGRARRAAASPARGTCRSPRAAADAGHDVTVSTLSADRPLPSPAGRLRLAPRGVAGRLSGRRGSLQRRRRLARRRSWASRDNTSRRSSRWMRARRRTPPPTARQWSLLTDRRDRGGSLRRPPEGSEVGVRSRRHAGRRRLRRQGVRFLSRSRDGRELTSSSTTRAASRRAGQFITMGGVSGNVEVKLSSPAASSDPESSTRELPRTYGEYADQQAALRAR